MATLMVHLALGRANTKLLQVTVDLAVRFNADVMGIATAQPLRPVYGDGYVPADVIEQGHEELEKEIKDAETEFSAALREHKGSIEWRSAITFASLAGYLADQSRCADLLITGVDRSRSMLDSLRQVDIGELIMQLGRPALIVPAATEKTSLKRVLIGWKDTHESRRAALDALPLLKKATHVAVCEIAPQDEIVTARERLADVVGWLKRNGIGADPIAVVATEDDATHLNAIASDHAADVIVAGAYGHSRFREWALGGVTKDLLSRVSRCSFVSH